LVNVLAVERGRLYGLSFGIYFKRFGVWHVSRFIFARRTESLPFTIYHPHSTPPSWSARLNVLGSKTCYVNTYDRTSAGFINTNINFCGAACGRFVYTDAMAKPPREFSNHPIHPIPKNTPQSLVMVYIIIPIHALQFA